MAVETSDALYRVFVAVFLGSWLAASILTIARWRGVAGRRRWDVFGMLSGWRLFVTAGQLHPSSRPMLVRDRMKDGTTGAPRAVVSGVMFWSPRAIFWDSNWDLEVLVRRLGKELHKDAKRPGQRPGQLRSYRHLAHIASRLPRSSPEAEARQFLILSTFPESARQLPHIVCESGFEPL